MKNILYILLFFSVFSLFSQRRDKEIIIDDNILIEGDTIEFDLDETKVFNKLKFKNAKEKKYYYWYRKKVHKAYPFAKQTATILKEIDENLKKIKSKRKKRKYIRKAQKYLNEEFKDQLKKLTRTEGKILIRLIHRQTGETVFDLIKKYRSGWKAFWYDSTAKIFKLSLKKEYHPESKALDFLVEDILQRAFVFESLQKQNSKLKIDYLQLSTKWKNIDIIKEIDNR